jgi:hypothetical protein
VSAWGRYGAGELIPDVNDWLTCMTADAVTKAAMGLVRAWWWLGVRNGVAGGVGVARASRACLCRRRTHTLGLLHSHSLTPQPTRATTTSTAHARLDRRT